jgi:hypothetical protein
LCKDQIKYVDHDASKGVADVVVVAAAAAAYVVVVIFFFNVTIDVEGTGYLGFKSLILIKEVIYYFRVTFDHFR